MDTFFFIAQLQLQLQKRLNNYQMSVNHILE